MLINNEALVLGLRRNGGIDLWYVKRSVCAKPLDLDLLIIFRADRALEPLSPHGYDCLRVAFQECCERGFLP